MFGYNTWEDFTPLDKIKGLTHIKSGVTIHWTGPLDWTTGLDYWTGLLDSPWHLDPWAWAARTLSARAT